MFVRENYKHRLEKKAVTLSFPKPGALDDRFFPKQWDGDFV